MDKYPHISIVIPTYSAPEHVEQCLASLAAVAYPSWDVLIADQSDDMRTHDVVDRFMPTMPQLRYLRLEVKGTCHARNVGMRDAVGDIVGFLDHDCTVESDWLTRVAEVAERHPRAAHIFGDVRTPDGTPEYTEKGWTPSQLTKEEFEATALGSIWNRLTLPSLTSMGACMFVRHETTRRVGFFDVQFGPGGRFQSAEDSDYTYRALMAGYSVVRTPAIWVKHHGFRDYKSGAAARHLHTYEYANGGWHMKVLRLGDPFALAWIARQIWICFKYTRLSHVFSGHGPTGLSHIVIYMQGLFGSFRLRVDRHTRLYAVR